MATKEEKSGKEAKVEEIAEVQTQATEAQEKSEDDVVEESQHKAPQRNPEMEGWEPKTSLGRDVLSGKVTEIDDVLSVGTKILESEIVDYLIPNGESDLLLIGQSKGKFGGGQRRVFRQTQKKTREGNKPQFATMAIFGDRDGHVGIGYGKSRETVPAREKAQRNAKLNVLKIRRGSGSWESTTTEPNSIPFKVTGKCGSAKITLMPAPKGTGLCVEKECAKILDLAGIKDVWSKSSGQTKTKINLIKACEEALRQLSETKVSDEQIKALNIVEGSYKGASQ